ncbi:hypothetical protein OIE13_06205 [Streptosporangium sp. NBC_01810]|uniref:hypothetical protein n=1 Tax=Streptosporangium sp. NBC_01810 TaxID=2975951 RepID=UPI002DDB2480|nr:hypothetical protein [Streptosporangium sp. NBC_01810]WSA27466.1 hypothetical protein OIE13_06205 [Streptosporangium sp. NBC_01810]
MPSRPESTGEAPGSLASYVVKYLESRPGRGGGHESYRQLELRSRDPQGDGKLRRQWLIDLTEERTGRPEEWRLRALAAGMARGEAEDGTEAYEDSYRRHLTSIRRLAAERWPGLEGEAARVELAGGDVIVIPAPAGLDEAGRRLVAEMAAEMARRLANKDS